MIAISGTPTLKDGAFASVVGFGYIGNSAQAQSDFLWNESTIPTSSGTLSVTFDIAYSIILDLGNGAVDADFFFNNQPAGSFSVEQGDQTPHTRSFTMNEPITANQPVSWGVDLKATSAGSNTVTSSIYILSVTATDPPSPETSAVPEPRSMLLLLISISFLLVVSARNGWIRYRGIAWIAWLFGPVLALAVTFYYQ
ncbi:MAG TPA: hypothetical protein VNL17_14370 [Verrucomicrobiae bacterium]|nr:hypothetical protein [Verrucomicrobiae bacterium]